MDGSLTNLDFLERECGSPMVKATPPRNDDDFDVDFRNAFEEVKKKNPFASIYLRAQKTLHVFFSALPYLQRTRKS